MGEGQSFLPEAVAQSRAVIRGVGTNIRFAAAYNAVGMAIAAAGLIHPVVAALLMVGSSAFVSVRALRSGERKGWHSERREGRGVNPLLQSEVK